MSTAELVAQLSAGEEGRRGEGHPAGGQEPRGAAGRARRRRRAVPAAAPGGRRAGRRAAHPCDRESAAARRRCWSTSGSTTSTSTADKGAVRWMLPAYEREAIRPHVLGTLPRAARRHRAAPGDALLPRQLDVDPGGPLAPKKGRTRASTRTTGASSWSCTPSGSTAATPSRTWRRWRAASPAGPSTGRSRMAASSSTAGRTTAARSACSAR